MWNAWVRVTCTPVNIAEYKIPNYTIKLNLNGQQWIMFGSGGKMLQKFTTLIIIRQSK